VDSHGVHVLEVVTNYVWAYAFSDMDCTDLDQGLLAPPQFTYLGGGGSDSDSNSLYDPNHGMDINSTC
jgi:hypothetical protein